MADEKQSAPSVAPADAAPAQAQVSTASPAPAAVETAPAVAESKPTLLQETVAAIEAKESPKTEAPKEAKPADAKPADIKAAEDKTKPSEAAPDKKAEEAKAATPEKKADVAAAEAKPEQKAEGEKPKLEPVEYKYTLPETLKIDDATKAEFNGALDKFRENAGEGAQGLIDLHNKSLQAAIKQKEQEQRTLFYATRDGWRNEIMADPHLGGAGHHTAAGAVARMRDLLADPADLQPRKWDDGSPRASAFDEFCEYTGAGDHPVFWRLLHNAGRWLDEPNAPSGNPKPPAKSGKAAREGGARTRMRDLYDHPRSNGQG